MSSQPQHLFVYGTLMQGFGNPFAATLRAGSTIVGEGSIPGKLYRVNWYPGALYLPEEKLRVWGEVYRVFDFEKLIPELDEYEGVLEEEAASQYLRRQVPVQLSDGESVVCWVYLYNRPIENLREIEGGQFSDSADPDE